MLGPENSFHGAPGKCLMTIWVKCEMSRVDAHLLSKGLVCFILKQGLVCFILQAHISFIYPRTKTKTCISFRQPNPSSLQSTQHLLQVTEILCFTSSLSFPTSDFVSYTKQVCFLCPMLNPQFFQSLYIGWFSGLIKVICSQDMFLDLFLNICQPLYIW